jgi:hypothetical protein
MALLHVRSLHEYRRKKRESVWGRGHGRRTTRGWIERSGRALSKSVLRDGMVGRLKVRDFKLDILGTVVVP